VIALRKASSHSPDQPTWFGFLLRPLLDRNLGLRPTRIAGEGFAMAVIRFDPNQRVDNEFLATYGEALLEWSYVEDRLFRWFTYLTAMSDRVARATFFSARSFQGRSEMLAAVVAATDFKGEAADLGKKFISDAITKANTYTSARNSLAHGLVIQVVDDQGRQTLIVQGRAERHQWSETGIRRETFAVVARNFERLANMIAEGLRLYRSERLPSLQACHEKLVLLPNEPTSATPSQKQLARLRQQKLVPRKKSPKP